MNTEIITLNVRTEGASDYVARMHCYIPESNGRKMRAVVVCPGGGYAMTSYCEGEPIALALAARGFAAFVLRYSVSPATYPQALCEAAMAVRTVRENAARWDILPDKILTCGFSAGGHLAANIGICWNSDVITDNLGGDSELYRVNGMILGYPVIEFSDRAHVGSFKNLLGEKFTPLEAVNHSLEKLVTEDSAPAFVWHTYDDPVVPVRNSLDLVSAMANKNISAELHIYPHGAHGLSLGTDYCAQSRDNVMINEDVQGWIDLAAKWADRL